MHQNLFYNFFAPNHFYKILWDQLFLIKIFGINILRGTIFFNKNFLRTIFLGTTFFSIIFLWPMVWRQNFLSPKCFGINMFLTLILLDTFFLNKLFWTEYFYTQLSFLVQTLISHSSRLTVPVWLNPSLAPACFDNKGKDKLRLKLG